jgi:hypothetical protein
MKREGWKLRWAIGIKDYGARVEQKASLHVGQRGYMQGLDHGWKQCIVRGM